MGTKRKTAAPGDGAAVMAAEAAQTEEKAAEAAQAEEKAAESEKQAAVQAEAPGAVHAAYAAYEEEPCAVRAGKGLNLRAGPGREFPVAAVLADGEAVNVLGLPYGVEVPGWALVAAPAGFGWVARDFLAAAGED